jgi:glutathione S-transferase
MADALVLYRAPFSTNVERVALALAHKGLEVESVVISYEDRSPVVEVSGQGLVPVLVDGAEVVADSTRILRHLEARWPDPPLFPRDAARRAELDVFLDWFNEVWKRAPNSIEDELERDRPDQELIAAHAAAMRASLDLFEQMLDGRDHLFGDELSAADCSAFPFLKFAKLRDPADDELFHRILEDNLKLAGGHPRLSAWIDRVNERPRA